ncbi:MAG: ARMT1-like domain-containing protein [Phycisphaerae bacterium]|nr:ARMT1-like domain-containing protein [Phycisphaerae bacterium]
MPIFCQLADPDRYVVSEWNIGADPVDREYWLGLFERFPSYIEPLLRADPLQAGVDFNAKWSAFLTEWHDGLVEIREQVEQGRRLMTINLTRYRNRLLAHYGWPDPYRQVKARENELATQLYPGVIERIDATSAEPRWELLFRSIFAGNMFDLGTPKTIEMYHNGQIDFHQILDRVPSRPWFIDHADTLIQRLNEPGRYRQVLIFVDNAGADIVLGVIPLAREMARVGLRVVLAANDGPTLNDITIDELRPLLQTLASSDKILSHLLTNDRLVAIGSGGDTPLIDLGRVSEICNHEAARSELVILEGMGRGVESNWEQRFQCDVARIALLKDESVVRHRGAKLFDAVCRCDFI